MRKQAASLSLTHKPPKQQRTMSHVKQLRTCSHREKATARKPRGRGSTEAAEVRHAQTSTSSKPVSYTQAAEATTNNENDNEPRRIVLITKMKPTRESDGAPTPRTKLNGSSRSAIYANRSSKPVSYTHTDQELPANKRQAAPSIERRSRAHKARVTR